MTVRSTLRRAALGALLGATIATAMTSSWAGCAAPEPAASADVDPGPTFGAEIALSIVGRGRVTSTPAGIDCPSTCFSRVVLADPSVDGGEGGVALVATETLGAHFVSWTVEELDLGVRARGPSQCSPMTRKSATPSFDATRLITVPFGETTGTPPRGREDECAAFTKVPVAYALTAVFEDDHVEPGRDAGRPDPGLPPLFDSVGNGAARDIGISSGYVYWRYDHNGVSGVAGGLVGATQAFALTAAFDTITVFDVDVHVAFQHSNGALEAIQGGTENVVTLGNAPTCVALASDATTVYCRANDFGSSTIYAWPISGSATPTVVSVLPPGRALAVDTQSFYFSDDQGGLPDQSSLASAPRNGDGGMAFTTTLVGNQTSPRNLLVTSSYLFWLDDRGGGVLSARSASKGGAASAQPSLTGTSVRFIAADPFGGSYFVGVIGVGNVTSAIYRAFAGSPSNMPIRDGILGLGGIASDGSYVYWTQSDGRVYRTLAGNNGFP